MVHHTSAAGSALAEPRLPTRVVGIGASAGGLDAIERFFDNVPKDTGMAFVVVQHLSPDFKSFMDELLARHTELPVALVEDGMVVEADHVYLIPSGKQMIISGGRLLLSEREQSPELTLPIDVFFRSLARDCGRHAVAIVLSGSGSDGSRGICDVVEAGGLVIVQDVQSAQFDGMPRMAIDAGVHRWVLEPQDMARVLLDHVAGTAPEPPAPVVPPALAMVYRMLRDQFGIDFTLYKPNTITRRIERRLSLARSQDIEEYVERLRAEHVELDRLYRDLLIGVTCFFRDAEAFARLESEVFPEILHRLPAGAPLRMWIAGCATGEEVYSLAILLQEVMEREGARPVKIFATDVHPSSLETATQAIYDEEALANVSQERLARFFLRCGDRYQVVPDLRQSIVFAQHDVIKDAPFTRMDFVACRNLLIYLRQKPQEKVLSLFHFGLNRGGVLFLGPSETVEPLGPAFDTLDRTWRIFKKRISVPLFEGRSARPATSLEGRTFAVPVAPPGGRQPLGQLLGLYDALLDDAMPAGLLLTQRGDLVHAFAGGSKFLAPRDGRQDLDVLALVAPDLRMILSGGLKRVSAENPSVSYKGVRLSVAGASGRYRIVLKRVVGRRGGEAHVLVSFELLEQEAAPPQPADEVDLDLVPRQHISALESELASTREHLQSTIEQLEASNEELQASNEELHTSNEELQSTNEELQSVNEELYTVNAEYQRKIAELTVLTNDMDNLLASTEVGTIFLDGELRIRKFTPQSAEAFSLLPQDVGRPIETFASRIAHPGLMEDLRRVRGGSGPVEKEIVGAQGRAYFLRLLPYRAKGTIEGVVLTLIDVSGMKAAEDALFHERYLLGSLLAGVPDAIYFKDAGGRFLRANQVMAARFGLSDPADAVGRTPFELPNKEAAMAMHEGDEAVLRSGEAQHYRLERRAQADLPGWDLVTRLPLRDRSGRVVGIIVIFRDVTEVKKAEEQIHDGVLRRDQFLAMLSHELRNPLGAVVTAVGMLKSVGTAVAPARLLEVLERQSMQMARLLDDLLEASRVTQNKIELRKRALDLREVLRDAVEAVRPQVDERGLQLAVELDLDPLVVEGDPARLQQIHVNLLSNAAKYTPAGGHVTLSARREGDAAVVSVRDDGVGIPQEMLGQVFDLFVQARRTLDRSAGGIGVGLTLVRALVEKHGGTVEAASAGEGKGSDFVVRLPLATGPAVEDALGASRVTLPVLLPDVGGYVLVVDDNADSRELLCELLVHAGFTCRMAVGGAEALALMGEGPPDIAILDIGLPEMDGLELARRIRRDPRVGRPHLIALTGYGQAADRSAARDAGFDHHLVKPVQPEELLALLAGLQRSMPHAGEGAVN